MRWLIHFIVRFRTAVSLFLTVSASLWMIGSGESRRRDIARALTISIFYPFEYTVSQTTRIRNIFAENRRLREQVTALSIEMAGYREQAAENRRLRKMLDLRDSTSFELVPSRVIARDLSYNFRSVVVNAGSGRGIRKYMPVMNTDGVVGKVVLALPNISLVQLLRDPSNRTGVMVRRSRALGVLETEEGDYFFIRFPPHEDIAEGDTVLTSGLGGVYPRGLLVGTIAGMEDDADPLFRKGWIKTAADFHHLEELFIIRLSPEWAAFREAIDSLGPIQ